MFLVLFDNPRQRHVSYIQHTHLISHSALYPHPTQRYLLIHQQSGVRLLPACKSHFSALSSFIHPKHPPTTANMTCDIVSYNRGQAQSFVSLPSARRLFLYIIPLEARLVHDNMNYTGENLPHAAHAAHTAHSRWWATGRLVLALHDSHLGCAEERCHTRGVDETGAYDLEGIQDAVKRLDCDI